MKDNTTKNVIKSKTIAIHKEINELMIKTCRYTKQSMKQKAITNTFDVGSKCKTEKETTNNGNTKRKRKDDREHKHKTKSSAARPNRNKQSRRRNRK